MSAGEHAASGARGRLPAGSGSAESGRPDRVIQPIPAGAMPVMEAVGISKGFGATTALVDVSLKAYSGRILALLGDNGAGKSTLIKILSGVFPPDRGELRFNGDPVRFANPGDARSRGIATVFQDLAVCELLSVTRNIVLGREPQRGAGPLKWLDLRRADEMARSALHRLGVRWERGLKQKVGTMSGGERQSLAIARAEYRGARLLILDEPTSALGVNEAAIVLRHVIRARARGLGVVFITHNVHHALPIGDRFVILSRGRVAGTYPRAELDETTLNRLMGGGAEFDELQRELLELDAQLKKTVAA